MAGAFCFEEIIMVKSSVSNRPCGSMAKDSPLNDK